MHIKSEKVQSLRIGMVWEFEEWMPVCPPKLILRVLSSIAIRLFVKVSGEIQPSPVVGLRKGKIPLQTSGLMAWAAISIDRGKDLHIIRNGNLTAQSYSGSDIHVILYAAAIDDSLLLVQDNVRSQQLVLCRTFLKLK
ncbi:hypothetical protein TNCV_1919311 [Trichonephila clavipes]|nr:hypothetical protein TNCV_1919311 [Trichonephila clavipes]